MQGYEWKTDNKEYHIQINIYVYNSISRSNHHQRCFFDSHSLFTSGSLSSAESCGFRCPSQIKPRKQRVQTSS
jgi:hypothetical protein